MLGTATVTKDRSKRGRVNIGSIISIFMPNMQKRFHWISITVNNNLFIVFSLFGDEASLPI